MESVSKYLDKSFEFLWSNHFFFRCSYLKFENWLRILFTKNADQNWLWYFLRNYWTRFIINSQNSSLSYEGWYVVKEIEFINLLVSHIICSAPKSCPKLVMARVLLTSSLSQKHGMGFSVLFRANRKEIGK